MFEPALQFVVQFEFELEYSVESELCLSWRLSRELSLGMGFNSSPGLSLGLSWGLRSSLGPCWSWRLRLGLHSSLSSSDFRSESGSRGPKRAHSLCALRCSLNTHFHFKCLVLQGSYSPFPCDCFPGARFNFN